MAEPSGFMTDLPQSAYLSLSIRRAISAAQQRSHRYVTLEHLLLALLDDPDAMAMLEGTRADIAAIKVSAADTVNRNLATLYTPGEFDLRASYKVERVLQTASDDADRLACQEVDAAFVLAALSRESDNPAADILKRNSFAYTTAMTWLYTNRGKSMSGRPAPKPAPAAPHPATQPEAPPPREGGFAEATPQSQRQNSSSASTHEREDELSDLELELLEEDEAAAQPRRDRREPQLETAPQPAQPRPQPATASPAPSLSRKLEEQAYPVDQWSDPDSPPVSAPPPGLAPRRRDYAAPAPMPQSAPRRAEPQMPSPARLEEMRVRTGPALSRAPLPAPAPAPPPPTSMSKKAAKRPAATPAKAAAADRAKGRTRRQRPHEALLGRLVENIPRRMRAAIAERIEVRISREDTLALTRGMEGRAEPVRHELMVTQAMSVALRAPDGGFAIEPLSPETQWVFDRPDAGDAELYGRWRWVVTPSETGQRRLQLVVAGRSIDLNGLVGDTALPDQVITVQVNTNYVRSLGNGLKWIAAMVLGGVLTELAIMGVRIIDKAP